MSLKTTDLYDEFSAEVRVCLPIFRSFVGRAQFSGPASTIKCFEDNSRVKEAVNQPGEGRVLVVDGGGSLRCALPGDLPIEVAGVNITPGDWIYVDADGVLVAGRALPTKQP